MAEALGRNSTLTTLKLAGALCARATRGRRDVGMCGCVEGGVVWLRGRGQVCDVWRAGGVCEWCGVWKG